MNGVVIEAYFDPGTPVLHLIVESILGAGPHANVRIDLSDPVVGSPQYTQLLHYIRDAAHDRHIAVKNGQIDPKISFVGLSVRVLKDPITFQWYLMQD